jgi:3'-phosphoadenosine 5'-phosphosulfate (PAPS) 3'-phosphatase
MAGRRSRKLTAASVAIRRCLTDSLRELSGPTVHEMGSSSPVTHADLLAQQILEFAR